MKTDQPVEIEMTKRTPRRAECADAASAAPRERALKTDTPGDPGSETPGASMRGLFCLSDQQLLQIYMSGGYY